MLAHMDPPRKAMNKKIFFGFMCLNMAIMIVVDYFMGERASFFNAWALLVHTARLFADLHLTDATRTFILHQDRLGRLGVPAAWAFFIMFHTFTALLLSYIAGKVYARRRKV
jgi:hypothetical protein